MVTEEAIILPSFSMYLTVTLLPALTFSFILAPETSKVISPFLPFTIIVLAAVSRFVTLPVNVMGLLFVTVVLVVVVVVCSDVPAGAWANVPVANATLISTASANINTFFIFFLLL
jgi:hypothetical protein